MSSAVALWVSVIYIVISVMWEGRIDLAEKAYKLLAGDQGSATPIMDPWYLMPVEEFPEFWSCEDSSCVVDLDRKAKVEEILTTLKSDLKAVRVVFSVYGYSYRRLAAQTRSAHQRPVSQELWIIPLSQAGYGENIGNHEQGLCNNISVAELPEGSMLRVEAPLYNTTFIKNCPVNKFDVPYHVEGYVNADFAQQPENLAQVEVLLRKAAEDIEAVMGYDAAAEAS